MKFLLLTSLLLASYAAAEDILNIATNRGFNTLITALNTAGLISAFDNPYSCQFSWDQFWCPKYTVFAPTDDAFNALPDDTLDRLLDVEFLPHLKDLLLYHVVGGEIFSSDIIDGAIIETLNLETIVANVNDGSITINSDSNITVADLDATNGVVHVIDNVLLPRSVANNIAEAATEAGLSILVSLLTTEGVNLGDFVSNSNNVLTIFAPTDDAFQRLIDEGFDTSNPVVVTDLLKYHVIQDNVITSDELHQGEILTVQGSPISVDFVWSSWYDYEIKLNEGVSITQTDILASNGIIHVIDTVLTPPDAEGDIVAIVSGNTEFSNLVTAIAKAELVTTLQEEGPFTVFAPTNKAFRKAGVDVDTATKEELIPILLYHVLSGSKVLSEDLSSTVIQTNPINRTNLVVNVWNGWFSRHITLNDDVNVIGVDVEASNGVIHVIDDVLIPPDNIVDIVVNSDFSTLVNLLSTEGVDLVTTLMDDGPFTVFAPTNAAFDRLGEVNLTTDQLKNVLLYHVVQGNFRISDLISEGYVDTAFVNKGVTQTLKVIVNRFLWWITSLGIKGDVNIEESGFVAKDILAANGFIHAIDKVLLPNLPTSSTCKTVEALDDFNIDSYASNKWYSHQQRPLQFTSEALFYCITAQYSFLDSDNPYPEPEGIQNGFSIKVFNRSQDANGTIFTSDDGLSEGGQVSSSLCAVPGFFHGDKDSELTVGLCNVNASTRQQSNYWVLAYDEEEGAALIAGGQVDLPNENGDELCTYNGTMNGLWIFTRSQVRNETLINKYRGIATEKGIDPSMMKNVSQVGCEVV